MIHRDPVAPVDKRAFPRAGDDLYLMRCTAQALCQRPGHPFRAASAFWRNPVTQQGNLHDTTLGSALDGLGRGRVSHSTIAIIAATCPISWIPISQPAPYSPHCAMSNVPSGMIDKIVMICTVIENSIRRSV